MSSRFVLITLLLVSAAGCGKQVRVQEPRQPGLPTPQALIPAPVSVDAASGAFTITAATRIVVPPSDARVQVLGQYLSDFIGLAAAEEPLKVEPLSGTAPAGNIQLSLGAVASIGDEGYELTVTPERVTIVANAPAGLFYGIQTFRQLLPPFVEHGAVRADKTRPVTAPAVKIVDHPRYPWRGAMLDVSRHFFTVEEVKRYVDLLALHKMNRLHLHLSDDQGWRIEIKSRPRLTEIGSRSEVGGGSGGFYTQEQFADLVAYAADRFVTIVPEIDMPSHINAALASYPELNCDQKPRPFYIGTEVGFSNFCVESEATYAFIDDVVREIAAMTPGAWFHVGGDEVKTLTPEQYVAFIERVQTIVHSHGKQMVGWDETARARLLPTSIVQYWRPDEPPGPAVQNGAKVILSSADRVYIDMQYDPGTPIGLHWAAYIPVRNAYDWEPSTHVPGITDANMLGIEAPMWAETLDNIRDIEYLAFPRLAAIAELAWSPMAKRQPWDTFKVRLGAQAPRWTALGINFYRAPEVPWR
ncbi:MAG: beta-N-acetylhexosaminidase [Acidobacteriota bacterium]